MINRLLKFSLLSFFLILTFNQNVAFSSNFDESIKNIRAEINRDELDNAIKLLKKISINNEKEEEHINVLFGDIYLKINQADKAEEFYQKTIFASNELIEARALNGLAEVRLMQGKLDDAIDYAERSIKLNPNLIRPKVVLAITKTRIGESEEGLKILNKLNDNKNAEVVLAISDYYSSIDNTKKAISILEKFIRGSPNNIKVLDQLASLYLYDGDVEKALEYKFKVYKYHEFNRNRKKQKKIKSWILSVDPKYFDKPKKIKNNKKENNEYKEEEVENYEKNKIKPEYEQFTFAPDSHGSGFVVGKGKYVITNFHVIEDAKKIAVRNGIGKVRNAKIVAISKDYDLAILELEKSYPKKFSLEGKDFTTPKAGDDVISIGYPGIGMTFDQPTITQGIVSKVFDNNLGLFLTTAAINSGNSGGPIFNLNGKLIGVSVAMIDKKKYLDDTGTIPTDMGIGIKSDMIKEVFKHKKVNNIKSIKLDKTKIYQEMLPSIVIVVVSRGSEYITKKKN